MSEKNKKLKENMQAFIVGLAGVEEWAGALLSLLDEDGFKSRELSIARTKIEEAHMWMDSFLVRKLRELKSKGVIKDPQAFMQEVIAGMKQQSETENPPEETKAANIEVVSSIPPNTPTETQ